MLDFLTLPERSAKPRDVGITHVLDKGLGPAQITDLIVTAGSYIDIVKLGWGTACVTPRLADKVAQYNDAGIPVCFGGTLFELALKQGRLDDLIRLAAELGMEHIEISDGTVPMPEEDKLALIRRLARDFKVLSEVGSKDAELVLAPYRWVDAIRKEIDAGAWKVVTEGRESGTVGMYQPNGQVKEGLLEEIVQAVSSERLLFEAPNKSQQSWFITHFGADVNLGNIPPDDVISLETLRLGLRSDTLLHFH